jgi:hypothetical protein
LPRFGPSNGAEKEAMAEISDARPRRPGSAAGTASG